jgi:hypothetical protein
MYRFYLGLKENVKDEISRGSRPGTLNEIIELAIRINNRAHECVLEKSDSCSSHSKPNGFSYPMMYRPSHPTHSSTHTHQVPDYDDGGVCPMEVDASRRKFPPFKKRKPFQQKLSNPPRDFEGRYKKLSDVKKQHRTKNDLCFYCGKSGHIARQCPEKNSRKSVRITETVVRYNAAEGAAKNECAQ